MHVSIFGTHPSQMNGYSKVVYELLQALSIKEDIQLSIFGFQNTNVNNNHRKSMPSNVFIHDAAIHENPKSHGFGFEQVNCFLATHRPDVIVIYNDCMIISEILKQINKIEKRDFKIVLYVDQVYPYIPKMFINLINEKADAVILFTKYWEQCIKEQGVTVPTHVLEHGFNKNNYFNVPVDVARKYFGINENDYIVLNLNRNQPRKRWDICLKAWAEVVKKHQDEPIKLLIGTSVHGAWNLLEIYERELKKRDLTLEIGMKHIIMIDSPQTLSDTDVNILYNVADLGLTTCDGEGWGLCSFEHLAVGVPQIAPRLGGFLDFLTDENATLIDPSWAYYVDNTRDLVGGEANVCNYVDFVDAIELHYSQKTKRSKTHREEIISKYAWDKIANKFVDIMKQVNPEGSMIIEPDIIPIEFTQQAKTTEYVTQKEFNEMTKRLDTLLSMMAKHALTS